MPATITGLVLADGLIAAVLSDTLTLTAPRSTAAELRFCSTRYQVCLNFQLHIWQFGSGLILVAEHHRWVELEAALLEELMRRGFLEW